MPSRSGVITQRWRSPPSSSSDSRPGVRAAKCNSVKFFRRLGEENRGDQFASWGGATYYFASDDSGRVERQIEVYEDGHVLDYDLVRVSDKYGGLTDQPLDLDEFAPFELTEAEFVTETKQLRPSNRFGN
jgi:hypothetical protein